MSYTKFLTRCLPSVILITLVLCGYHWALYVMATLTWILGAFFAAATTFTKFTPDIAEDTIQTLAEQTALLSFVQWVYSTIIAVIIIWLYIYHGLYITSVVSAICMLYSMKLHYLAHARRSK